MGKREPKESWAAGRSRMDAHRCLAPGLSFPSSSRSFSRPLPAACSEKREKAAKVAGNNDALGANVHCIRYQFFILRNNLRVFLEIDFHLRNYFGQIFTLRNHLGGNSRDLIFIFGIISGEVSVLRNHLGGISRDLICTFGIISSGVSIHRNYLGGFSRDKIFCTSELSYWIFHLRSNVRPSYALQNHLASSQVNEAGLKLQHE
jgi:hypothetical protein